VKAVKRKKGNSYLTYKMAKGMLKSKLSKIPVVTTEGLEFYPISEVLYIKRSGKGSKIFFKNRLQTSSDRSLNEFQSFIDSERFQFLESYLVNGDEIMDNDRVIKRLRFQNGEILNYML
jgi:DNA-binding LytR/AlgR family response regulator